MPARRKEFQNALRLHKSLDKSNDRTPPSWSALRMLFIASAIPFVGFGFLDNFIMVRRPWQSFCVMYRGQRWAMHKVAGWRAPPHMVGTRTGPHRHSALGCGVGACSRPQLVAGEEIDEAFGRQLGLSTLASAGLGNLVADVIGVGAANGIEVRLRR